MKSDVTEFHTNLCQLLSSEVECDGLCVSRVVDFDVDLVVVFILADQCRFQTGHLVLLAVDQNLETQIQMVSCYCERAPLVV